MKRISFRLAATLLMIIFSVLTGKIAKANPERFEFYNNTRSLGMGGASVALSSDETSLYRNPANLASVRSFYLTYFDPELEASTYSVQRVYEVAIGKTDASTSQYLEANKGTYYYSKVQLTPSFVRKNFGFGLIYKKEMGGQMKADAMSYDIKSHEDVGVLLGFGYGLMGGVVKIGASVKAINRIEVDDENIPPTSSIDPINIGNEGTAISYDVGLLIQAPWKALPTIGAVVRDVGNTVFDKYDGLRQTTTLRPKEVLQSVDVAISLFPIHSKNLRSLWTVEYRDLSNAYEESDLIKKLHVGVEFNSNDLFFFRAGLNQKYWTAGLEIAGRYTTWQLASYGEEVGTVDTPKEDRRFSTKVSLRF